MTLIEYYVHSNPLIKIEDIKQYKELNDYELLIELYDGQKYIYDTLNNTTRGAPYYGILTDKENRKEFKLRLRALLSHTGMTQRDLSEKTGISERTITRYMNGETLPDYISIKKLSNALNIPVNQLYFENF